MVSVALLGYLCFKEWFNRKLNSRICQQTPLDGQLYKPIDSVPYNSEPIRELIHSNPVGWLGTPLKPCDSYYVWLESRTLQIENSNETNLTCKQWQPYIIAIIMFVGIKGRVYNSKRLALWMQANSLPRNM